MFVSALVDLMP